MVQTRQRVGQTFKDAASSDSAGMGAWSVPIRTASPAARAISGVVKRFMG
jgi:hypothetical protein